MQKRGISPLIATVLLIAFAIVLAAVVVNWGQNIIKGAQEESPAAGISICPKVDIKIEEVHRNPSPTLSNRIEVNVRNDGEIPIKAAIIRLFEPRTSGPTDKIETVEKEGNPLIEPFGTANILITQTDNNLTKPTKVEVIPEIEVENKLIPCQGASVTSEIP